MTIDQARRLQLMSRWHRRIALVVVIWIMVLAVTGILINHANDWGLDRRPVAAPLQQLLYGIERRTPDFCDHAPALGPECVDIFAALQIPGIELLLSPNRLYLLDEQGRLIEQLGAAQLGLDEVVGGLADGADIYLRDSNRAIVSDPELLDWRAVDASAAAELQGFDWQVRAAAEAVITWERVLLDLHAARFLGPLAKSFTDLSAALILLLGVSGAWLWWLKRRRD